MNNSAEMKSYTIKELAVGQKASISKLVTEDVVKAFAEVTEDRNPVHLDEKAAKESIFGERIAHGMFSAGLISAVLGTRLPGLGVIYMSQSLKFTAPVKIGDTVTAEVEVLELDPDRNRVKMKTTGRNQNGVIVVEGEALLKPKR